MQIRNSTQLMNEHLLSDKSLPTKKSGSSASLYFQFIYIVINSFINTYYDTSNEITDTFELETNFLNTAKQAAIAGLILGLYFSVCQGFSQKAQSKNFDQNPLENDREITSPRFPTKILAYSHFFAEINNGAQPLIVFSKLAGMKTLSPWKIALTYLGITTLSALGNFQELLNTLVAFREEGVGTQARTPTHKFWKIAQFGLNLINTLLKTSFTLGTLVTDQWNFEKSFLSISWQGYAVSLPFAIFFSLCESMAHAATSEHFRRAEINDIETAQPQLVTSKKLNALQNILSIGHFTSDIVEGFEAPYVICKQLNVDKQPGIVKGFTYGAMGLYSLFGNIQEFKNTRTAFLEENDKSATSTPLAI